MRSNLSTAELASYSRNGFLAMPDFLDQSELAEWRDALDAALFERGDFNLPDRKFKVDEYKDLVFTVRINLWKTSSRMRALSCDVRLASLAARLANVPAIRLHHDQALIKPAYGNPTGWHADVPYWSCHSRDTISVWVALDDADVQNGCLMYIPGSHHAERFEPVTLDNRIAGLFDIYPDWATTEPVPCPVPAGGCVFHNGLTCHLAGPNLTPRPRRAITCGYMPDGVTYNGLPNVLPRTYAQQLSIGDPLCDDDVNSLVFPAP